jgi:hypothetical protein
MAQKLSQTKQTVSKSMKGSALRGLTDFNPDPESPLISATNISLDDSRLRQNDRNGQAESDWCDIDHVASDDAEVKDLGVEATHLVESGFLLSSNHTRRQRRTRPLIDWRPLPASSRGQAMEHAALL